MEPSACPGNLAPSKTAYRRLSSLSSDNQPVGKSGNA